MATTKPRVCFIGLGASAVCYYRIMLPGLFLGQDWCGVTGDPPEMRWATGMIRDAEGNPRSRIPDLFEYDIVVVQQPKGGKWAKLIKALQEKGVKVIFEVDDYIHGIQHQEDHDFRHVFTKTTLSDMEWAMRKCDAVICSTPFIAEQYSNFNKRVHVCRNGIDLGRYDLTIPKRASVNVGWAGATGHTEAVIPWFQQLARIMAMRPNVNFVSIGKMFAEGFRMHFPHERAIPVPWAAIEQYPSAMTMMDIALAPAGRGGWWQGKSDLRWLEASALGIPVIADPQNYPDLEHGITGFHAASPYEAAEYMLRLIDDKLLRHRIGEQAKNYVRSHRSMPVAVKQWERVFEKVLNDSERSQGRAAA